MEVFGLLNLLNSLLPSPPQKREDAPAPPPPSADAQPSPEPQNEPPNACLDFFAKHEQRAKQRKK